MNQERNKKLVFPPKLAHGDEIRIISPSRSIGALLRLGSLNEKDIRYAVSQLEGMELKVTMGSGVWDCDEHLQTPIETRIEDLHQAFLDKNVKGILSVSGGIGAIQLLDCIDYELIRNHPKVFCGYSDNAFLQNAFFSSSGLVSYYGPNFASFMMRKGLEYTLEYFQKCLFSELRFAITPSALWTDDKWASDQENRCFQKNNGYWVINEGEATGTIVGGNLSCLNMLQGSKYFPSLDNAILFLENPSEGKVTLCSLASSLRGLMFQNSFSKVSAIVLGRFPGSANIRCQDLKQLITLFPGLTRIPIIANVDFGHTTPTVTFPIGGRCFLCGIGENVKLRIEAH